MPRASMWRGAALAAAVMLPGTVVANVREPSADAAPTAPSAGRRYVADLIAVQRRGAPVVSTLPGGLVSVAFLVRNLGGRPVRVRTEAELPRGWQRVVRRDEQVLAGRASVVHVLTVRVLADARPGSYTLVYRAAAGAAGAARDSVTVLVEAVRALVLSVAEAPRFVAAGEIGRASCRERV